MKNRQSASMELTYDELIKLNIDNYNKKKGDLKGYYCENCLNKGHIMIIKNGYECIKICDCKKTRTSIKRLDDSGLRDLSKKCRFDNYLVKSKWQEEIKNKALEFAGAESREWFFIGGQVGAGKTHICVAISNALMEKGNKTIYMLWRTASIELKAKINDISYTTEIDKYKKADILYIDDLFKSEKGKKPTYADINLAYEIINARYMSNKQTIISCEHLTDQLIDIDAALGSRIFEKSKKYCFNLGNDRSKNFRLK